MKLGDVCDFEGGSQPPKSEFVYEEKPGYVRFLQIRDFNSDKNITFIPQSRKNRLCKQSDILIGRYGASVGKILTNKAGAYNVALMKTIPNLEVLDRSWFYNYLISDEFQSRLLNVASRSAQDGFSKDDIYGFPVPVPIRTEQQRIVGILDEAFDGIATAKANAEKNLQNARALFESYLHAVFTRCGDGWIEKSLGDVCEYVNGKAHEQCIDENGEFIVVNSKFISSEGKTFKKSNQALLLLRPGDIAMVLSDVPNGKALAKCYLVEQANTYTLNQRICLIRSAQFHTKFLFYQLNRNKHFLALDNGENQTNMRLNQVLSCPLFLPPISEQESIAAMLDDMSEETGRLESIYRRKLAALDELKKSLLHQAFNGEL